MRLSQEAMNSVSQFWWIVCWILERNCEDEEAYFDDVWINGLKTTYNNEEILPGV